MCNPINLALLRRYCRADRPARPRFAAIIAIYRDDCGIRRRYTQGSDGEFRKARKAIARAWMTVTLVDCRAVSTPSAGRERLGGNYVYGRYDVIVVAPREYAI
jgi:hypothetical protein